MSRVFPAPWLGVAGEILCVLMLVVVSAHAGDWSVPEQQLARKIAGITGPGAVALTVENRSSLNRRDSEIIQNGLRNAIERLGIRYVKAEQAAATIAISLSENPGEYVWVAEIRQGAGEVAVVMVSVPRPEGAISATRESVPMSLRKISLWTQEDAILDAAVLEENSVPTRIAVLSAEQVAVYRWQSSKWTLEETLAIAHSRPWPRDLRGRLMPAKDHLLDVYLPGVVCRASAGAPVTLNCRETDDPWPMVPAGLSGVSFAAFPSAGATPVMVPAMSAFYAPARNFFTGVLTPGVGKFTSVPPFYSAAVLPRDKYLLWIFAATDGHARLVDGVSDQSTKLSWGDLASVKTACGAGWQVLATSAQEGNGDQIRAYEFPDRDAVPVSAAIDFPGGAVTALWTEAKGDLAIAVVKNQTGTYEAYRLAISCSQ